MAARRNAEAAVPPDETLTVGLLALKPRFDLEEEIWFADLLIGREYSMDWFGFLRADFILRDHANGVMEKLVRSGLAHVCIGVERVEDEQLGDWKKKFYSNSRTVETFDILKKHYRSFHLQEYISRIW